MGAVETCSAQTCSAECLHRAARLGLGLGLTLILTLTLTLTCTPAPPRAWKVQRATAPCEATTAALTGQTRPAGAAFGSRQPEA